MRTPIIGLVTIAILVIGMRGWTGTPHSKSAPPDPSVTNMHETYVEQFIQNPGFGMGRMTPVNRFALVPLTINSNEYMLQTWELISLLKHDAPVVYNARPNTSPREQPLPADMDKPPPDIRIGRLTRHGTKYTPPNTRELTPVESRALKQLQAGRDLAINHTAKPPQIVGALRAQSSCLKCHDVAIGDLLGAFTYTLREIDFIQPAALSPEQIQAPQN